MNRKFSSIFTIGIFLVYLCTLTFSNFPNMRSTFITARTKNTKDEVINYQQTFVDFESTLASGLEEKNEYITINGGFARLLGEKELNSRVKIGENLHHYEATATNHDGVLTNTESIVAFRDYLGERDIPFLYIQAPYPVSPDGEELESWMANTGNERATLLVEGLREEQVNVLDIREVMVAEGMSFTDAFYKTDHHWKFETAFWAVGQALEEISDMTDIKFDPFYSDINNWTQTLYEDSFLGSHGKREGTLYAGVDDINVLLPDFETDLTYQVPHSKINKTGTLKNIFFNKTTLEINSLDDYMSKNTYTVYGSDYGYEVIENHLSYHDFKVLVIDDSFGIPFTRYLIPHVSELHMVDFRYGEKWEVADFYKALEEIQPDFVYILFNPGATNNTAQFKINPNNLS